MKEYIEIWDNDQWWRKPGRAKPIISQRKNSEHLIRWIAGAGGETLPTGRQIGGKFIVGDVKRSGKTYEERKAISIAKQKAESERRKIEIEASKTPEQKLRRNRAMMDLMMLLGMAGAYNPKK